MTTMLVMEDQEVEACLVAGSLILALEEDKWRWRRSSSVDQYSAAATTATRVGDGCT